MPVPIHQANAGISDSGRRQVASSRVVANINVNSTVRGGGPVRVRHTGQRADGSQKDGFLKYEKNRPAGVYDLESGEYKMFDPEGWSGELDRKLGPLTDGYTPWKRLLTDPANYELLLRRILERPQHSRPGVGTAPNFETSTTAPLFPRPNDHSPS